MSDIEKLDDVGLAELGQAVAALQVKRAVSARALAAHASHRRPSDAAPAAPAPTRYLSRKEVADLIGCNEKTVTRKVASGEWPEPLTHKRGEHARWRADLFDALKLVSIFDRMNAADEAASPPMSDVVRT